MRLATLRAGGLVALQEIVDHNLLLLAEILEWNRAQGIAMFRISSDLVPFGSHEAVDLAQVRFDTELLSRIADATAGVRLSMHPGQFTVLSTADQDVLQRSVAELRYHDALLTRLGLSGDLVLHGGGVYGDRPAAAERLVRQIRALPEPVRERICLEGDERAWSVEQLLPICEEAGVPLIVDTLHHAINGETSLDQLPWLRIRDTWGDRKPKIHYSEQDPERRPGAHSTVATPRPVPGGGRGDRDAFLRCDAGVQGQGSGAAGSGCRAGGDRRVARDELLGDAGGPGSCTEIGGPEGSCFITTAPDL